jgi:hypothetical protein
VQNAGMVASDGLDELERVIAQLDDRARSDERLEQYRVAGAGPRALDAIPDGWVVSDGMARIAERGGWWPGEWMFPELSGIVQDVLIDYEKPPGDPGVSWVGVGSVWERDWFFTPTLRDHAADAPLCGFSGQALWLSMVFPTEAAILEAVPRDLRRARDRRERDGRPVLRRVDHVTASERATRGGTRPSPAGRAVTTVVDQPSVLGSRSDAAAERRGLAPRGDTGDARHRSLMPATADPRRPPSQPCVGSSRPAASPSRVDCRSSGPNAMHIASSRSTPAAAYCSTISGVTWLK